MDIEELEQLTDYATWPNVNKKDFKSEANRKKN